MGAISPSAGPIAPFGASLGTPYIICTYLGAKLCCTAAPKLLIGILLPRWHQQRAPEVMLYRRAQASDILPR